MFYLSRFSKLVFMFSYMLLSIFLFSSSSFSIVVEGSPTTTISKPDTLKVVLVQFADVKWDKFWNSSTSDWEPFYYKHKLNNFDSLLASLGVYNNKKNCDGDSVYGSFRDYFWDMSKHQYTPVVKILNSADENGYPIWVELPNNKTTYTFWSFKSAARKVSWKARPEKTSTPIFKCVRSMRFIDFPIYQGSKSKGMRINSGTFTTNS